MEALDAIDNGIEVSEGPLRYRDGSSLPGARGGPGPAPREPPQAAYTASTSPPF